jgi:hypothetical protein
MASGDVTSDAGSFEGRNGVLMLRVHAFGMIRQNFDHAALAHVAMSAAVYHALQLFL